VSDGGSGTTAPPPDRRWPWKWIVPGVVVAVLVVYPVAVRSLGRSQLAETRARLAGEGFGAGPEDLRRGAPAVDAMLQGRWRDVVRRAVSMERIKVRIAVADWVVGNVAAEPPGGRKQLEDDAALRAEAAALLAEGPPVAGALGAWLSGSGDPSTVSIPSENILGVKCLADAFDLEACLAADPGAALAALDRLHDAFAHPGALLDGMIGTMVADRRDEVHVRLAHAGRLPREVADRWLAEPPVEPYRVAASLRGERLLVLGPLLEGFEKGTIQADVFASGGGGGSGGSLRIFDNGGERSAWWLHGFSAGALVLEHEARWEAALRDGTAGPEPIAADGLRGAVVNQMDPNMAAVCSSAYMARARHRLARLYVRVVRMAGEPEGVPADTGALRKRLGADAALLDPGPVDPALVLERPAPGLVRVRVAFDPNPPAALRRMYVPEIPKALPGKPSFAWKYGYIDARLPR
jgi:hypothetical protein